MKRREFIAIVGGAAAWPLAAGAQQPQRARLVGILMPFPESDAAQQTRFRTFRQELTKLGWSEGSDVQFDVRWTTQYGSRANCRYGAREVETGCHRDHW